MKLHKGYAALLLFNAVAFAFFAVKWMLFPEAMATGLGIHLTNADAITDAQAVYGGLELGVGVFLTVCALRPSLQWAGLIAAALTLAGLGTCRGLGILLAAGPITGATKQLLATDSFGAVLNSVVLFFAWRARASSRA